MFEALLTVMLALAPRESAERLRTVATAIASTAGSRTDAAVLAAISFHETRFERSGVPFGVVSWRRRVEGRPLEVGARAALQMYGNAAHCGASIAVRLGWYHTGNCRADAWSTRETDTVERILAALPRDPTPVVAHVSHGAPPVAMISGLFHFGSVSPSTPVTSHRARHSHRRHHHHHHVDASR